jgi:Domain of unknown function (DUF4178)
MASPPTASPSCPSCGAELRFRSSVSIYTVCSYCGSMVIRSGPAVEAIGKMALLPEDISPLQVGTTLIHADRHFTLLGRYRMGWADGAWTEWFMDDGSSQAWLAHAQGFLSVAFEHELPPALAAAPWPALGDELTVDANTYRVTDLKQATCIGSEGELPFAAIPGRVVHYADMTGRSAGFASLEQSDDGRQLYTGMNVGFEGLRFDNLRPVEDWTPPVAGPARARDPQFPPRP